MRALVLGGTGMLGRAVVAVWRRRGAAVLAPSHAQADLLRPDSLAAVADAFRPTVVVNCAAFTKVDDCEKERELAFAVNGAGVAHAVALAERFGGLLLHVSSDYVFAGDGDRPYREDDPTGPRSVYGASKLAGEAAALASASSVVVRASWLFGPGGPNFVATMVRLVSEGKVPLRVVDDQVGRPTYTGHLAEGLWELARVAGSQGFRGVVHYGDDPPISWHGFARAIVRRLDPGFARHVEQGVDVVPIMTRDFPRPAPRPAYSVLDVSRYETSTGRRVSPWLRGLVETLDFLQERAR